ncbi:MAG: 16S rRNA (cytosine(1402)-N(4))-methyltransferase RsmH [Ectothiorhodospiraceae bacterium]|nr:16S rRNA (cytosine(1402)-N(4))-methyltransferase RsmH [Ectothiorhodospiraceae bacterium]
MSEDFANRPDEHKPVLFDEVLDGLAIKPDGIYIDGTFGRGGHAGAILSRLGPEGRLLAIDKDPQAIEAGNVMFGSDPRFAIEQGSFTQLESLVQKRGWQQHNGVDGILLDLGVSSPQLDDPERGFSFRHDGDLDMRMDPSVGQSAAEWLAKAEAYDIRRVLREYGEEKFAKRIAYAIVNARIENPIKTTGQLAALIAEASPVHERGKDPATRSFQAIRIFINDELGDVKACLPQTLNVLRPGGRLAVISFHSLEDRIVKRFMRDEARGDYFPPDLPIPHSALSPGVRLIGKAVRATPQEVDANPRARSAVLRIAERL